MTAVTADGGRNVHGYEIGVVRRTCENVIRINSHNLITFNCLKHEETLCCKILAFVTKEVMDTVILTLDCLDGTD